MTNEEIEKIKEIERIKREVHRQDDFDNWLGAMTFVGAFFIVLFILIKVFV